jgi:hypothetical protein
MELYLITKNKLKELLLAYHLHQFEIESYNHNVYDEEHYNANIYTKYHYIAAYLQKPRNELDSSASFDLCVEKDIQKYQKY